MKKDGTSKFLCTERNEETIDTPSSCKAEAAHQIKPRLKRQSPNHQYKELRRVHEDSLAQDKFSVINWIYTNLEARLIGGTGNQVKRRLW